ncbi:GNAT family N-acetyltransferase [Pirellulimonas nuda]|nr:GNAT family N-acetyltransferase [Pirellulimonas nuda]
MHALPAWVLRVRPFEVLEIPLADLPAVCLPAVQGIEVRWVASPIEAGELRQLVARRNIDRWDGNASRAAAVWQDGAPIGVLHVALDSFDEPELGVAFRLAAGDAWLHSAVVAPPYRRQGVYRQLLAFALESLRREGLHRALLGVTVGNETSRRAHASQGGRHVGRVSAVRCLGLSACLIGGAVRRVEADRNGRGGPTLLTVGHG